MTDSQGRPIDYLRLSLTEKCDLRCVYCRDENAPGGEKPSGAPELSLGEIEALLPCLETLGIHKVRLTGGEPLMRDDLEDVVALIRRNAHIRDLALTTNAQNFSPRAGALKKAGLMRVNLSINSLDPQRYREITGGGSLDKAFVGLGAALAAGLTPVKINCVLLSGTDEAEAAAFLRLAQQLRVHIRFIERMPIGTLEPGGTGITAAEILKNHPGLKPVTPRTPGVARCYSGADFRGTVGFISPISEKFCGQCNRIRITADGKLRPCLGRNTEVDLRPFLADGGPPLLDRIRSAIYNKPQDHHFGDGFAANRRMNEIGG